MLFLVHPLSLSLSLDHSISYLVIDSKQFENRQS